MGLPNKNLLDNDSLDKVTGGVETVPREKKNKVNATGAVQAASIGTTIGTTTGNITGETTDIMCPKCRVKRKFYVYSGGRGYCSVCNQMVDI